MQMTSRMTVAVHTLLAIDYFQADYKVTSDFLAASVQVNPVVIRRILLSLRDAGLVTVARGSGGASLARPPERITLLDVCRAVEGTEPGQLFRFHANPNPQCPVGRQIHGVLDKHLLQAQEAFESSLAAVPIADLRREMN